MRLLLLSCLVLSLCPGIASATGVAGTVTRSGQPVFPCDIDIVNRQTGATVPIPGDTTLPNGSFNLVLPNGRYDITFHPAAGTHAFDGFIQDARVENNTLNFNVSLATGAYLSGRVTGANGAGVASANIRFRDSAGQPPANVQDGATRPDGTFQALVTPGTWNVEVIPPFATRRAPVEFPGVNVATDATLGDIAAPAGALLTFSVTDGSLFPISGAKVTAKRIPGRDDAFTPNNSTSGAGGVQLVLAFGTYDLIVEPSSAQVLTYATNTQYSYVVSADATVPNFVLPPGRQVSAKVVGGAGSANVVNADIDVDWMQAPAFPRVETANDFTNALGNFSVTLGSGSYRITVNPPVSTKLLPLRLNNVNVGAGNLNLGTLTCATGHWLDVTVLNSATGLPVKGANIDLENAVTGVKLITVGDVTNASGFARLVSDAELYRVIVNPPNGTLDTAYVPGFFRTLSDTAITIHMTPFGTLGVQPPAGPALRLAAPWPNPAARGVNFAFSGAGAGELEILDLSGRRVATPWRGDAATGVTVRWEGRDDAGREVPNGVYFARFRAGGGYAVRRLVVAH